MLGRRDVGLVGRLLKGTMLLLLLVLGVGRRRHRIGVDGLRRAGVARLVRHVDGFPDPPLARLTSSAEFRGPGGG